MPGISTDEDNVCRTIAIRGKRVPDGMVRGGKVSCAPAQSSVAVQDGGKIAHHKVIRGEIHARGGCGTPGDRFSNTCGKAADEIALITHGVLIVENFRPMLLQLCE